MKSLYVLATIFLASCGDKNADNEDKGTTVPISKDVQKSPRKSSESNTQKTETKPSPTFEWINPNIFNSKCVACHNSQNKSAGVDLSSFESIANSTRFPKLIEPLLPDGSLIFRVVQAGSMPPGEQKLTENEMAALKKWIETGARKSESDPIPTPIPTPTEPPD